MAAVPVIIARLYDGNQLVREVPQMFNDSAPETIQMMDAPPERLRELDRQFGESSSMVPFSVWTRRAWGSTSVIDRDEWHQMTKDDPPSKAQITLPGRPTLVAVRYAEYELKGNRA